MSQSQKIPRSQSTFVNDSITKRVRVDNENTIVELENNQAHSSNSRVNDSDSIISEGSDYEIDEPEIKISKCWEHFTRKKLKIIKIGKLTPKGKIKPNKIVICKLQKKNNNGPCGKVLSYKDNSTGKMIRHLTRKHSISTKKNSESESDPINYLLMFIITASLPFRCIENKFFKMFCESLNPKFKIPSRQHLANLSSKFYNDKKELMKKKIENVSIINITTDCWTSIQNFSYVSLTGHFLDENFLPKYLLFSIRHILGGHSAKNIGEYLLGIFDEFGIREKVKFITTDNAKTMAKMASYIKIERIPSYISIGHIIHLIIQNCLKSIKDNCKQANDEIDYETEYAKITFQSYSNEFIIFNKALKKCCSIATLYNHSTIIKEKLSMLQKDAGKNLHSIIQQVPTRWNSVFLMVERIIENFQFLNVLLASDTKQKRLELNSEEIRVLKSSIDILKPFYGITCQISSDKSNTSSMIIPTFTFINKVLSPTSINNDDFSEGLKEILEIFTNFYVKKYSILENQQSSPVLNKKTQSENQLNDSQAVNLSINLSDSSDEENEIEVNWRSVKKELNNYILESKQSDVFNFWKTNAIKYPILVEYFKTYALAPATSTASERLFKRTGYQVWDRRNKISPERVEQIMFLYENIEKI
ncbi:unnamed protein product [Brachionus calyciflorus]|uniref:HAT C-terminal dimerisation domain-containing protein n=1 Tax=Brachionus calyciflorus TaxID=104777 RepID=A0A814FP64_9BILA|nr:unnamed protein product [Brachionus calyciflorus]